MIPIKKNKEPNELLTYRLSSSLNPTYQDMKGLKISQFIEGGSDDILYDVVLDSLIKEQGEICAYCMRKIPQKKQFPKATIEHVIPQNQTDSKKALDYWNMVAVCNGNRNATDNNEKTCDAKRGTLPVDKQDLALNPLKPTTLSRLMYSESGVISSADDREQNCIEEVLNLNHKGLVEARKSALRALQEAVYKEFQGRDVSKEFLMKCIETYEQQTSKSAYIGILLFWLNKKIRQKK